MNGEIENWVRSVAEASQTFLDQKGPYDWLIKQSIYTHFQRLIPLLSMSGLKTPGGAILDVGAGTGALAIDLAWRAGDGGRVTVLDRDPEALQILRTIAERVGVKIEALAGDAAAIPVRDASQDMTVSRFLFQHLRDPLAVLVQMRRVTRPGGRVVIVDVDDEVWVMEPPEFPRVAAWRKALRTLQRRQGGDRQIGRKLYGLMRQAGFEAIQVLVIPFVRLGLQQGRRAEVEEFKIERLFRERDELIDSGLMTAGDFEAAVSELKQGFALDRFEMDAEFVAVGAVPAV
ncbi:MAG: class I SAM-dependent methyltransferase [Syntrophobacteraceae bacterium]